MAVLALVPACGDDSGNPGDFIGLDAFDSSYKDAECTYLVRCGFFADKMTCLSATLTGNSMFTLSAQMRVEILAGRVSYNGNNVKACFDALANATCDKTDESGRVLPVQCSGFTHGTIAGGAACMANADCISGYCSGSTQQTCSGTCVGDTAPSTTPAGLGESCSSLNSCIAGLYCDHTTFKCAPLKAAGEACTQTDGSECAYGLGCAGTTTRTCKALPLVNEPCPDGVCRDDGVHCVSGTTPTCKAYGLAGAVCTTSTDCSPYFPCDFTTTSPYMCKKPPSVGEACTTGNTRCFEEHSYCDSTTLRCTAGKADGATCTSAIQCVSLDCDTATMTCISPTPACGG